MIVIQSSLQLADLVADALNDHRVQIDPTARITVTINGRLAQVVPSPSGWNVREVKVGE